MSAGLQITAIHPASAAPPVAVLVQAVALSSLSPPSPDPAGIAYLPGAGELLVSDSEVEEMAIYQDANLFQLTLSGSKTRTGRTTAYSNEPTGLSFDPVGDHLFVADDVLRRIFVVSLGIDGEVGTGDDTVVASFDTSAYGNTDPEDVAFDVDTGDLFVSDGIGTEVYRISDGGNGVFDGVPPIGDDTTSHFDVARFGAEDSEGLAYDADRGTLLVLDRSTGAIYETNKDGFLVAAIDISAAAANHPADVVLAPGSSDPDRTNLYIVARGEDNDGNPTENDGMLYEMSVDRPPVGNLSPMVSAGPNQAVTLPSGATLSGSAVDDGLPSGTLTTTWSQISGPPSAIIASPSSLTTTVGFSEAGTYVFRLTADDSALDTTDDVTVFVAAPGATILERPVAVSSDDAEESATGAVNLNSSDLELVLDGSRGNQTVGLRFTGVTIPKGAPVTSAYVQFQVDRASSVATSLTIRGQAADNPGTFKKATTDISSRPRTGQSVAWSPVPTWPTAGAAGSDQRTPNIAPVLQEIVNRTGWASGNAMVIIITGSGKRAAESFNGNAPPVLHIEYGGAGQNLAPVVNAGPDQQVTLPDTATMAGSATDDGLPNGTLTTTWSQVSGPQGVDFADPSSPSSTVTFFEAGTYVLRLTAYDGALETSDELTVTVNSAGSTNLVGNPGFEVDTAGWNTGGSIAGAALTRVSGGHGGSWAAQLANGSGSSGMCILNDSPNWVGTTVAGTYSGSLWARADAAGATLRLRFREYNGGTQVGTPTISQVQLTTAWQLVTVTRVPQSPGTSTLDLTAYISTAPPGTCFYADDVVITPP